MFTSINKHSALCLYCDEVSAILQALHIRALLSRSSGKANLIVTRGMLKPVYFAFVETISDFCLFVCFFFLQTTYFAPWIQRSVRKIPKMK